MKSGKFAIDYLSVEIGFLLLDLFENIIARENISDAMELWFN